MKAIMVMFDSLNRNFLPCYGNDWVQAPNFRRLAARCATFDNSYIGSMPCMPARRELHTGRYNFLHRSWGPLEPFDDSMPEILRFSGVYTHLASDHNHYWEDGGCTYHHRYQSWESFRGQEGDRWKGQVTPPPDMPAQNAKRGQMGRHDWINRAHLVDEADWPQARTFAAGLEFIETNAGDDDWFLQLETFDPHEPFLAPQRYRDLYPDDWTGPLYDWPDYGPVQEPAGQVQHCRREYAALVSMCDAWLGKVLEVMDRLDLWKDTLLIVNTDHGYLLGEHDHWAKCVQPFFDEVARTPLFIHDPRHPGAAGTRRQALVQTIDLAPTLLQFFGREIPPDMQGKSLEEPVADDTPVRDAGLFGLHGGHVNLVDDRHVYMRGPIDPTNRPLYNYTLMPTHMRSLFSVDELKDFSVAEPFAFTKGLRTMQIAGHEWAKSRREYPTLLFDRRKDPGQLHPLDDPALEARLATRMVELMAENDAPPEQYARLGLAMPCRLSARPQVD